MTAGNFEAESFDEQYTAYQLNRSIFRKAVRWFYLQRAARLCRGKVIDFGCGIGELLSRLPKGSLGLEVNPATVKYAKSKGMLVNEYNPDEDQYGLKGIKVGEYSTIIVSHVLEHLEEPNKVLEALANSASRLQIGRIVIIVPGACGFRSDITHRTFISPSYLQEHNLLDLSGYKLSTLEYFPVNAAWFGNYFRHNELTVVYDRVTKLQNNHNAQGSNDASTAAANT